MPDPILLLPPSLSDPDKVYALNCQRCRSRHWLTGIRVLKTVGGEQVRLVIIQCVGCKMVLPLDDGAILQGKGNLEAPVPAMTGLTPN
ncbi:MAG: hypothetical protein IH904_00055 [Proteobacteria bacterium]|nr:hypothetical protein [Pseudomonadota bacterium]